MYNQLLNVRDAEYTQTLSAIDKETQHKDA